MTAAGRVIFFPPGGKSSVMARRLLRIPPNRDMRHEDGFSLVEFLISFALIAFLLAGTAELITAAFLAKKKADAGTRLTALMISRLEALRTLSFDDAGLVPGDSQETFRDPVSGESFLLTRRVEALSPNLKRISLQGSWEGRPRTRSRLVLYRLREAGFEP